LKDRVKEICKTIDLEYNNKKDIISVYIKDGFLERVTSVGSGRDFQSRGYLFI